jgi:hypothetical protein
MLKWITCYLSGRHDYKVSCEPGAIYLCCTHCGRRSNGWDLQHQHGLQPAPVRVEESRPVVRTALRTAR